jgi:hypothetical protein
MWTTHKGETFFADLGWAISQPESAGSSQQVGYEKGS